MLSIKTDTNMSQITAAPGQIMAIPTGNYVNKTPLGTVSILGIAKKPESILVNEVPLDPASWSYSEEKQFLLMEDLEKYFLDGVWNTGCFFNWVS